MIKLKTIYRTKNGLYLVILRHPKAKWYELHFSAFLSNLEDFNYLLKKCNPVLSLNKLSDIRYYACKMIDGVI